MVKPDTAGVGRKGERRPIVVDGCNVGFQYGKNKVFRAKGLQVVYHYFMSKGIINDLLYARVDDRMATFSIIMIPYFCVTEFMPSIVFA